MKLKRNELIILVILAAGLLILLLLSPLLLEITRSDTAEISFYSHTQTVKLNEYKTFTLSEIFKDYTDSLPDMTFEVDEQGIRVIASDCPGNDCVHMGYAHKNNGVIVCVPNRVTVRLVDIENAFDAVI
jgi:hypothetical protein